MNNDEWEEVYWNARLMEVRHQLDYWTRQRDQVKRRNFGNLFGTSNTYRVLDIMVTQLNNRLIEILGVMSVQDIQEQRYAEST